VRQATGVADAETSYVESRSTKAAAALESWLESLDAGFGSIGGGSNGWGDWNEGSSASGKAPIVALASSGGGYRAMLAGGGVVKGFDAREANKTGVSGIYQALTYHAGLSGGSWLLSSIAGNDFPTISQLETLWEPMLQASLLVPAILVSSEAAAAYSAIEADIAAKKAAGYETTIIDSWGRILSYALLTGTDGGVQDTMSSIAQLSNFTSHQAPFPIITALGVQPGQCVPPVNATQYEFTPYEFGSWDAGVDAFVVSEFLGTVMSNGSPKSSCVTNYDQLGYVLGTSSNVFAVACSAIPANKTASASATSLIENFAALAAPGQPGLPESGLFGLYPNPFQGYSASPLVASEPTLELVDGGVSVVPQVNPIWPFLHRPDVDVLIVNDNDADTAENFPNGTEIYNTYTVSRAAGLTRMPVIPPVSTFIAEGFNQVPTFFGCNSSDTLTIIYIPNYNYTYPSGEPTAKIQYYANETVGMVDNGVQIASYGGKANWPLCLGCGIMKKSGVKLAEGCEACFEEYCYN
jgi:lysophospholipase